MSGLYGRALCALAGRCRSSTSHGLGCCRRRRVRCCRATQGCRNELLGRARRRARRIPVELVYGRTVHSGPAGGYSRSRRPRCQIDHRTGHHRESLPLDGAAAGPSPVLFGSPRTRRSCPGSPAPSAPGRWPQLSRPGRIPNEGRSQGQMGPGLPVRRDYESDRTGLRLSGEHRRRDDLRLSFRGGAPCGTHAVGRGRSGLRYVSRPCVSSRFIVSGLAAGPRRDPGAGRRCDGCRLCTACPRSCGRIRNDVRQACGRGNPTGIQLFGRQGLGRNQCGSFVDGARRTPRYGCCRLRVVRAIRRLCRGVSGRSDEESAETGAYAFLSKLPLEILTPLMRSDPRYLETALAWMDEEYGSVMDFIREELDVTRAELSAIRAQLLE